MEPVPNQLSGNAGEDCAGPAAGPGGIALSRIESNSGTRGAACRWAGGRTPSSSSGSMDPPRDNGKSAGGAGVIGYAVGTSTLGGALAHIASLSSTWISISSIMIRSPAESRAIRLRSSGRTASFNMMGQLPTCSRKYMPLTQRTTAWWRET